MKRILLSLFLVASYGATAQRVWIPIFDSIGNAGTLQNWFSEIHFNSKNEMYANGLSPCFGSTMCKKIGNMWFTRFYNCDEGTIQLIKSDASGNTYSWLRDFRLILTYNGNEGIINKINDSPYVTVDSGLISNGSFTYRKAHDYSWYEVSPSGTIYGSGKLVFQTDPNLKRASVFQWNNTSWIPLIGTGADTIASGIKVSQIKWINNKLHAVVYNPSINKKYIARWEGTNWFELKSMGNSYPFREINNITTDSSNNVFVEGQSTTFSVTASNRFMWHKQTQNWLRIDVDTINTILSPYSDTCLWFNSIQQDKFGNYYGISNCLNSNGKVHPVIWNGNSWQPLGNYNVNGWLRSLAIDTFGVVHIGGNFIGTTRNHATYKFDFLASTDKLLLSANKQNGLVELQFTSNLKDVTNYLIEESNNAKEFKTISSIKNDNKEVYSLNHTPNFAINYYRVKAIANNGNTKYSNTIAINTKISKDALEIFPNPVQSQLFIKTNKAKSISIIDVFGKECLQQTMLNQQYISLNLSKLSSGIYWVKCLLEDGSIEVKKVLKQ